MIQLTGQKRATHLELREKLRATLQKMHQEEQKILAQFGVQNYQEIKDLDPTIQRVFEEIHKAYKTGGQYDELMTRHLKEGVEVVPDFSDIEAAINELNNLLNVSSN